ncbi:MAG: RDD family protein [Rhodocyclales bacterium]|nr:RDD family protein [Rhodocyclales bacterium]
MVYETLLVLGVLVVLIVPLFLLAATANILVPGAIMRVYLVLCLALYFIWHWHAGRQTLAMRTWRLMIATPAGNAPPLWRLALRYVLAWPSLTLFGAGILWALVDRDRQFLHDRLAGTRIIFAPPTRS